MIDSPFPFPDPPRPVSGEIETHRLVASGSGLAVAVQFEQRRGIAGFETVVLGLESTVSTATVARPPVVISALDIPLGKGWEFRTSGLWAEQVCEQRFDHWSYGLEAFALAIDEPDELARQAHGHRVPLGWEFDFVAETGPEATGAGDAGSFTQTGTIDGLILTGRGEHPIQGPARRSRWAGDRPAHTDIDLLQDQDRSRPGSVVLPTLFGPWTVAGPLT